MEEMQEVWENGGTYGDDAYYDTCQHAWRLLEIAVAMSNPKVTLDAHRNKPESEETP